ncbi:V-type proton ATPase subunit S1-like [Rhineura floridana]|uniref:V-type proton ATPase subunit S1-like n=1 Tax=Rhineura floridana TaxID=261503 RepID=UPI002AC87055|nr:V-type proton ATPase subunit S1-like [Rhineura floridana]
MARCGAVSWVHLLCFISMLCQGALSLDHVPMLLWSTHRSFQGLATTLHEGHIISKQELHMLLKHAIVSPDPRNFLLFLQDTLSVDDFTRYADPSGNETPFRNVQELLKTSSSSLVLPAVDCHAVRHLSRYLQETLKWPIVNVDGKDISQLVVNVSKPNVFVIKLPPNKRTNELSTRKELLENDKIIGAVTKSLQQQGIESVAIYTARRPSKVPVGPDEAWHTRRQLMSVENQTSDLYVPVNVTNGTDSNITCILFYATNFNLTANGTVPMNLTSSTFESHHVNTSASNCSMTDAMLSLQYTNLTNTIESLEIRFLMTNKYYNGSARNWFTLDFVHILQDNRETAVFNVSIISGPAEYSFHCQLVGTSNRYGVTLIPASSEAQYWEVVISEFQIQAFNVENNRFSYASDCSTFFTPAIWMGLVTSLILLLILTYGIHMIVNLTTNNRFDDPKDPPLSVPQTE